ncbi:MAG: hypothetical protein ACYDH9_23650 [Limisphaerales bacterium]
MKTIERVIRWALPVALLLTLTACYRWAVKVDPEPPPATIPADHDLKPSQIGSWDGPGGESRGDTSRTGKENEWFRATGKVTLAKSTLDGDLHLELVDADGASDVTLIVEVPRGKPWEAVREKVAGLRVKDGPVIRVTGKAFYDAEHVKRHTAGNRRGQGHTAVWEIHPVMKLEVISN